MSKSLKLSSDQYQDSLLTSDNLCTVSTKSNKKDKKQNKNSNINYNYIKLSRADFSKWLLKTYPKAFLLLSYISIHARRTVDNYDGLIVGDCLIGKPEDCGLTRQEYRTALERLEKLEIIKIVSNGKNFFEREKSTINITITGHLVNLIDSRVYDINPEVDNQHINQRPTNDQPTTNHIQECTRNNKNVKESNSNDLSDADFAAAAFFIENQVKDLPLEFRCKISEKDQKTLVHEYFFQFGEERIENAFKCLKSKQKKGNILNPTGFLIDTIKKGWKVEKVNFYTKQQIEILDYCQYLRENGFKPLADKNEKIIQENQPKFFVFRGYNHDRGYWLKPEDYHVNMSIDELEVLINLSRTEIYKYAESERKRAAIKSK